MLLRVVASRLGSVIGCLVRYNKELMGDTRTPYSFECTVSMGGIVEGFEEVEDVARDSAELLGGLLSVGIELGGGVRWEFIGRRYNLYAFPLTMRGDGVGELRVVEVGGYIVGIAGALASLIEVHADEETMLSIKEKREVKKGTTMEPVLLDATPVRTGAPSQYVVPKFVVYVAEGGVPDIDVSRWRLIVRREGVSVASFTYRDIAERSRSLGEFSFHCVTGWSTKPHKWSGVPLSELLEEVGVESKAEWLAAKSPTGYSTIVPLREALREGFIVTRMDGKPLSREHGFPARLFFPKLYGWKAAKWIAELILLDHYEDGFWESLAYHERGLAAAEERFKIRNTRISPDLLSSAESRKLPPPRKG